MSDAVTGFLDTPILWVSAQTCRVSTWNVSICLSAIRVLRLEALLESLSHPTLWLLTRRTPVGQLVGTSPIPDTLVHLAHPSASFHATSRVSFSWHTRILACTVRHNDHSFRQLLTQTHANGNQVQRGTMITRSVSSWQGVR